jgi:response regulator RpfG family c-di-GMP phosphodiesterase
LEQALDEIRQKKGILYDGGVVDACLQMFQAGDFSFI